MNWGQYFNSDMLVNLALPIVIGLPSVINAAGILKYPSNLGEIGQSIAGTAIIETKVKIFKNLNFSGLRLLTISCSSWV